MTSWVRDGSLAQIILDDLPLHLPRKIRVTSWSDDRRVVGVSPTIDQGKGYTVVLFNRAAVTPPTDDSDRQAYELWDGGFPEDCRKPRP